MGKRHTRPKPEYLAKKLHQIRQSMGLTFEQMAFALRRVKKSSPTKASIYRFERGEREPSLLVLLEYAKVAGVPLETLVDDELDLPKSLTKRR